MTNGRAESDRVRDCKINQRQRVAYEEDKLMIFSVMLHMNSNQNSIHRPGIPFSAFRVTECMQSN